MGSGISSPLNQNLNALHNQLMKHAGADYDIATATTLTYSHFISYITELNKICADYKDKQGCVLVFAVKKGTDANLFWKATVRIACVKLNTNTNQVESHRLLTIRQFLQVFRRISYECTEGTIGIPPADNTIAEGATANPPSPLPPTVAASMILGEAQSREFQEPQEPHCSGHSAKGKGLMVTNLEECIICLERKPEVILPCCHAYCTPCIEQWWEYCQMPNDEVCFPHNFLESVEINEKSCPVCRESLDSSEDTWILSEAPDQKEVSEEIRKALISYATSAGPCREPGTSSLQKQPSENS